MRPALLAMAAVISICVVGCGGDGESGTEPLTLEQRLFLESEVPGSKPDPMEKPVAAGSLGVFMALDLPATRIGSMKLEEAGFVSAAQATRFIPETPDGSHTREAPHARLLVVRFDSDDGADEGADLLHEQAMEPCPGTCAERITEFEVDGVPDARGVRRYTSAEELEATGEEGEPFDSYSIVFSDGPFAYEVEAFGPPGAASEEQAKEIAAKLYERVEGAPAPGA